MDKQQKAIDIIKKYYLAEEQNDLSDMIRSVCSYFDYMKNQELSSGDIDFLQDLSNSIGVPQYVKLLDADGNEIKYESTGSGRKYTLPVWGVRGHPRTLQNGKITFVRPYPKGKDRKNPDALISKEYKFVEDKINLDTETTENKSGL